MNPRYRRCKCLRPRVRHRRLGRWGGRSSRRPRGVMGGMGGGWALSRPTARRSEFAMSELVEMLKLSMLLVLW